MKNYLWWFFLNFRGTLDRFYRCSFNCFFGICFNFWLLCCYVRRCFFGRVFAFSILLRFFWFVCIFFFLLFFFRFAVLNCFYFFLWFFSRFLHVVFYSFCLRANLRDIGNRLVGFDRANHFRLNTVLDFLLSRNDLFGTFIGWHNLLRFSCHPAALLTRQTTQRLKITNTFLRRTPTLERLNLYKR